MSKSCQEVFKKISKSCQKLSNIVKKMSKKWLLIALGLWTVQFLLSTHINTLLVTSLYVQHHMSATWKTESPVLFHLCLYSSTKPPLLALWNWSNSNKVLTQQHICTCPRNKSISWMQILVLKKESFYIWMLLFFLKLTSPYFFHFTVKMGL